MTSAASRKLFGADPEGVDVPEEISHVNASARDGHASETPRLHVEGPKESAVRGIESGHCLAADGENDAVGKRDRRHDGTIERVPPHDSAGGGIDCTDRAEDGGI